MFDIATALIIDPDVQSRRSLKACLSSLVDFEVIRITSSPEERGLSEMSLTTYDLIFVSLSISSDKLVRLIKLVKNSPYNIGVGIILLAEKQSEPPSLTGFYTAGADGFLSYPYSTERIEEVISLCRESREKHKAARRRNALYLLVNEMTAQVSYVAKLKKSGKNATISTRMLKEMCLVLTELDPEALEVYYEILLEILPELPPPGIAVPSRDTYRADSERVRFLEANQRLAEVKRMMVA